MSTSFACIFSPKSSRYSEQKHWNSKCIECIVFFFWVYGTKLIGQRLLHLYAHASVTCHRLIESRFPESYKEMSIHTVCSSSAWPIYCRNATAKELIGYDCFQAVSVCFLLCLLTLKRMRFFKNEPFLTPKLKTFCCKLRSFNFGLDEITVLIDSILYGIRESMETDFETGDVFHLWRVDKIRSWRRHQRCENTGRAYEITELSGVRVTGLSRNRNARMATWSGALWKHDTSTILSHSPPRPQIRFP